MATKKKAKKKARTRLASDMMHPVSEGMRQAPRPDVKLVKIEAPEPTRRFAVLQIDGHPEQLPEPMVPETPVKIEETPLKRTFWQWVFGE